MNAHKPTGLLAASLLFAAAPALADGPERIAAIERNIDEARFDEAEAAVRAALESGELSRPELARVHLSSGVIAAARRDSAGALSGFRRALSLDASAALPGSAGPHVAKLFEQAKQGSAVLLRAVASGAQPEPGRAARIRVRLISDPEKLAERLRVVRGEVRQERLFPPTDHTLELAPPARGCSEISAELLDTHGNRLWAAESVARVCASEAGAAAVPIDPGPAETQRPVGLPVWIGVGLTGAGLAATGVLGVIALDRRAEYHEANADLDRRESERSALRDDASGAARAATIAAVATGVVGAATLTLYLLRPAQSGPSAGISAAPGGARAVFGVRF